MITLTSILLFIVGFFGAFSVASMICGHYEGHRVSRSLTFHFKEKTLHIHHWIWGTALFVTILLSGVFNLFIFGILLGMIFQGLTYRDWNIVLYKTADFEKIYSGFKDKPHWGIDLRNKSREIFKK